MLNPGVFTHKLYLRFLFKHTCNIVCFVVDPEATFSKIFRKIFVNINVSKTFP